MKKELMKKVVDDMTSLDLKAKELELLYSIIRGEPK